ncbi:hypothetical protein [Lentilactobacillus kosonis]|uniref:Uncharacterized protein n=1 Tax=Lentilactobacillus kosonis TaxID=2810561 RepID=A0A401FM55_9LACO|nr:hypothetical protein [Lentilactobacillus kosonis]GAY73462.1 hypothetical protein NBRC111893_1608 [Lentilactobacillus kosonis]
MNNPKENTKQHKRFYKTFDFWFGLVITMTGLQDVPSESNHILFVLDAILLVYGIYLVIQSVRTDYKTKPQSGKSHS